MKKVAQYDFIKMREMRGEGGKKPLKKEMDNNSFYDVTCLFLTDFTQNLLNLVLTCYSSESHG